MANKVVSNTGPIIHLSEIFLTAALGIFNLVLIPEEVARELARNKIIIPKKVVVRPLNAQGKDNTMILMNEHNLDLGEAQAIALALQEKTDYFLTDDLDAREVGRIFNLEVHGTVGIILRAFREKILTKETALEKVRELQTKSSLFITSDLIEYIAKEINYFKKN